MTSNLNAIRKVSVFQKVPILRNFLFNEFFFERLRNFLVRGELSSLCSLLKTQTRFGLLWRICGKQLSGSSCFVASVRQTVGRVFSKGNETFFAKITRAYGDQLWFNRRKKQFESQKNFTRVCRIEGSKWEKISNSRGSFR